LSENEFRFTLASGNEIAKGIARGDEVTSRINSIEALYARTWQRLHKKEYQAQGRVSDEEAKVIQLFCRTPIAASFGIIFTIPEPKQMPLFPEHESMLPVVDEMLACIDLVNNGNMEELKKKIPETEYFQSFLINARKIAPDGDNVKQVGFTIYRDNKEKIFPFNRVQSQIVLDSTAVAETVKEEKKKGKREKVSVTGILMVSDSPKKYIRVDEIRQGPGKKGKPGKKRTIKHKVKFVTEAQKELVRDYYEEEVAVEVWRYDDKSLEFIDLKRT
jgi:hypothetical protein